MISPQIRLLIVDDHPMVRFGLQSLLKTIPEVTVVGEAGDGYAAMEAVDGLRPDVVVLDIELPGLDGLALLTQAVPARPATRFLVFSMHSEKHIVLRALKAGAAGYLLKDSKTAEMELAIQTVARGELYLSPRVSKHLVSGAAGRPGDAADLDKPLTARQREVLKLIAMGHTTKSIAHELNISLKTADTHRTQLMERLGIHEIAGLVRFAIGEGLVAPEFPRPTRP